MCAKGKTNKLEQIMADKLHIKARQIIYAQECE